GARVGRTEDRVAVCGDLLHGERDLFRTARFGQDKAVALVDGNASPQVRKGESGLSVAAVRRADEVEEGLVLGNGEKLSFAEHPSRRCEVAGEHPDLTYIWLCHRLRSF